MTVRVDVQFAVEEESVAGKEEISLWVARALTTAYPGSDAEVSVRVVDAAEMQRLNKEFREQDKSTNVLSFPAGEIVGLPGDADVPLGDIVVCSSVISAEAGQQGKPLVSHWAHMIVHGTLHLLGYDHVDDSDAMAMEAMEIRVLGDIGVANPYGESPQET